MVFIIDDQHNHIIFISMYIPMAATQHASSIILLFCPVFFNTRIPLGLANTDMVVVVVFFGGGGGGGGQNKKTKNPRQIITASHRTNVQPHLQ